ncbi:MAG: glycosyltransferase [Flavobacteriales bacterium]|jgi:UDP:flavonoid glycosyltransferase YjiC (YdhE family)|nr:glycosyltransferase [Flavobacteriales bacterium]
MSGLRDARVLVAPLDWGLGHAARCVPVVRALRARGAHPVLAADAGPLALLRAEFPELEHVRLPGITVRYAAGGSQFWSMARQLPAMVRSVAAERAAFDRIAADLRLDAVISDQRFGVRSAQLPSVLITHQLFPFTPFAQSALRRLNLQHVSRFDRCWVMDEPAVPGLAGELSHGTRLPPNVRYIGPVSRMAEGAGTPRSDHRVVAVISGPEPQRTLLEAILLEQLATLPGEHLLVQGLPQRPGTRRVGRVDVVGHLTGEALREALLGASLIVSRSGYTTLMDLAALGRSALIIPTPGQHEQEYLGRLHARTGRFLVQQQRAIDLAAALARPPSSAKASTGNALLCAALDELAGMLR